MSSVIIQIIGFIGLFFFVLSFQQVKRNRILALMVIGQGVFLVHFIWLGAWTAVGMNVIGMARTSVYLFRYERKWAAWPYWPVVFILLFASAGILANESWLGLLPVIAMSIETAGLWMRNLKLLRFINLFPHPFWFAYNLIKGSWAGVACEIFILSSVIIAIIRYDILKKNSLDSKKV